MVYMGQDTDGRWVINSINAMHQLAGFMNFDLHQVNPLTEKEAIRVRMASWW